MITTYSIFIFKVNNSVSTDIYNLLKLKRENFKALYSNFILGVLLQYSEIISLEIENKKIKFDGVIHFNPQNPIQGSSFINSFSNQLLNTYKPQLFIVGVSKPFLGIEFRTEKEIINIAKTTKSSFYFCKNSKNIQFNSNPELDKIRRFYHCKFANFKDEDTKFFLDEEYKRYSNIKNSQKISKEEYEDFLKNYNENELQSIPAFTSDSKNKFLVDASDNVRNLKNSMNDVISFTRDIVMNYDEKIYKHNFDNGKNELIVQDYTFRDLVNDSISNLSPSDQYMFKDLEDFHNLNKDKTPHEVAEELNKLIKFNPHLQTLLKAENKFIHPEPDPEEELIRAVLSFFDKH